MWTGSSLNVAKYLLDIITDQIMILISHIPIDEFSNNYIWEWDMLETWKKWSVPRENEKWRK